MNWDKPLSHREYMLWVFALVLLVVGGSIFVGMVWTFQDVIRAILEPDFVQMITWVLLVPAIAIAILLVTLLFSSGGSSDREPEAAEQQRITVRRARQIAPGVWREFDLERPAGYIEQPAGLIKRDR